MKKQYWLVGAELESYFESDADVLEAIENGEIYEAELIIDFDSKYAEYCFTNENNDGIYVKDDFEEAVKWIEINKLDGDTFY